MFEIRCVSIHDHDRLQTTVGPADVAADALRVCPMASGFGFADHVIIIIIIRRMSKIHEFWIRSNF
jgi:hypothetical protein